MKRQTMIIMIALMAIASSCVKTPINQAVPDEDQIEEVASTPAKDYASFIGEYETRPNENIRIFLEGNDLKIQGPGQPIMVLAPTANSKKFYLKEFDVHIEFAGQGNEISKLLMIRWDGQALESPKVK